MKNDNLRADRDDLDDFIPRASAKREKSLVLQVAAGVFLGGLRQTDAGHYHLRQLSQFARALSRGIVIDDVQRFGDLAFDRLGAFQAEDKTFGLAAGAVQFFSGASLSDCVEEFFGVWADAFGQADLRDAHANTSLLRIECFMARTFSANGRQRVSPLPGGHGRPLLRFW